MRDANVLLMLANPFMDNEEKIGLAIFCLHGLNNTAVHVEPNNYVGALKKLLSNGWIEEHLDPEDKITVLRLSSKCQVLFGNCIGWLMANDEIRQRLGPEWPWLRFEVLMRDNQTCRDCQGAVKDVVGRQKRLEIHHVKPVKQGGENTQDNLITLCSECHGRAESLARAGITWRPTHGITKELRCSKKWGKGRRYFMRKIQLKGRELVESVGEMDKASAAD